MAKRSRVGFSHEHLDIEQIDWHRRDTEADWHSCSAGCLKCPTLLRTVPLRGHDRNLPGGDDGRSQFPEINHLRRSQRRVAPWCLAHLEATAELVAGHSVAVAVEGADFALAKKRDRLGARVHLPAGALRAALHRRNAGQLHGR